MKSFVWSVAGGAFLLLPAFLVPGCVTIPEEHYVLSVRQGTESIESEAECGPAPLVASSLSGESGAGVDPGGFTLFNWNLMKGGGRGWVKDFARLTLDADVVTIQEAWLTEDLRGILGREWNHWDLTAAFLTREKETGVLTGSREQPAYSCSLSFPEPLTLFPKTVLASYYPVAGTDRHLLVANVHLINFTAGTREYREQLRQVEELLSGHDGPVVLLGDFNTWSDARMESVTGMTERMALAQVEFNPENLATFRGRSVDHVYYRGLVPTKARAVQVASSDHNPLLVTFRVP